MNAQSYTQTINLPRHSSLEDEGDQFPELVYETSIGGFRNAHWQSMVLGTGDYEGVYMGASPFHMRVIAPIGPTLVHLYYQDLNLPPILQATFQGNQTKPNWSLRLFPERIRGFHERVYSPTFEGIGWIERRARRIILGRGVERQIKETSDTLDLDGTNTVLLSQYAMPFADQIRNIMGMPINPIEEHFALLSQQMVNGQQMLFIKALSRLHLYTRAIELNTPEPGTSFQ